MNKFVSVFVLVIFAAVTVPSHAWANGCGGDGNDPTERKAKLQKKLWGRPASVEDAGQAMMDALMAFVGKGRWRPDGSQTNIFTVGEKVEGLSDISAFGTGRSTGELEPSSPSIGPAPTPFDLFGYGLFVLLTPPPPEKPVIPGANSDDPMSSKFLTLDEVGALTDKQKGIVTTVSVKKSLIKPSKPAANLDLDLKPEMDLGIPDAYSASLRHPNIGRVLEGREYYGNHKVGFVPIFSPNAEAASRNLAMSRSLAISSATNAVPMLELNLLAGGAIQNRDLPGAGAAHISARNSTIQSR